MDSEDLLKFVKTQGYRSYTDVINRYSDIDKEIIEMHLDNTVSRGLLREIKYTKQSEWSEMVERLFYVPA